MGEEKGHGNLHGEEESEDGDYGICVLGSERFGPWFAHHALKGIMVRME